MTSKIYSLEEIKSILVPIFIDYDIKRAIIFGSYGKQVPTVKSDIDLLVDSGLKGLRFVGLNEALRIALDKEVDLFDVKHITPQSKIDQEIRNTGVMLYEKS